VQKDIDNAIRRIVKTGKAAGILTPDETLARHYLDLGATFVAVGLDTNLLTRHTSALAAKFKASVAPVAAGKVY
jgi:4-hydroxy-2-oxoheptanedioate aldolase